MFLMLALFFLDVIFALVYITSIIVGFFWFRNRLMVCLYYYKYCYDNNRDGEILGALHMIGGGPDGVLLVHITKA